MSQSSNLMMLFLSVGEVAIYVDALDSYIRMMLNCLQTDDTRACRAQAQGLLEDAVGLAGETFCCSYIGTAQHPTGYGS